MKIEALEIPDITLISQQVHGDKRGYFIEIFNAEKWQAHNLPYTSFVQDNLSFSQKRGTVRGLHYQIGKNAQAKLFQCLQGAIQDVVVDLRKDSPFFGKSVSVELMGGSGQQILIPSGFAHGFATLEPDTIVQYKVSAPYDFSAERGILWSDPKLNIGWRIKAEDATLSEKDLKWPAFDDAEYF